MERWLLPLVFSLLSFTVYSAEKNLKNIFSGIEIVPLNSPVKESSAIFLIKVPAGFEIDKARYKIKK